MNDSDANNQSGDLNQPSKNLFLCLPGKDLAFPDQPRKCFYFIFFANIFSNYLCSTTTTTPPCKSCLCFNNKLFPTHLQLNEICSKLHQNSFRFLLFFSFFFFFDVVFCGVPVINSTSQAEIIYF